MDWMKHTHTQTGLVIAARVMGEKKRNLARQKKKLLCIATMLHRDERTYQKNTIQCISTKNGTSTIHMHIDCRFSFFSLTHSLRRTPILNVFLFFFIFKFQIEIACHFILVNCCQSN